MHKIGSLLSKSGLAIQFLFKFCFRNHDLNVKIEGDLRVQISEVAKVARNVVADLVLCDLVQTVNHYTIGDHCKIKIVSQEIENVLLP